MVYDDEPQVIIAEVEYMGPFRTCLSSFGFRNTVQPCNIVEQWHNTHVTFTIGLSEPGSNGIRLPNGQCTCCVPELGHCGVRVNSVK